MLQCCEWAKTELRGEFGVVIASDSSQEWLLPWWFRKFRKHNPDVFVTLFDLGMTTDGRNVAESLCHDVRKLEIPFKVLGWMCKPFAVVQAPYSIILWIDLDCEVLHSVREFGLLNSLINHLYLHPDEGTPPEWQAKLLPGEVMYNSGVLLVNNGHPAMPEWARACLEGLNYVRSDQEALSRVLHLRQTVVGELGAEWNNLRLDPPVRNPKIRHWTGPHGKAIIRDQIASQQWRKNFIQTEPRFTDDVL